MKKKVIVGIVLAILGLVVLLQLKNTNKSRQVGDRFAQPHTNVVMKMKVDMDEKTAQRLNLQEVVVGQNEIVIKIAPDLKNSTTKLPLYLNENFQDNSLTVPRETDLTKSRFEGADRMSESPSQKKYAFVMAFPIKEYDLFYLYGFLFLSGIEGDTAHFVYQEGHVDNNKEGIQWSPEHPYRVVNHFKR